MSTVIWCDHVRCVVEESRTEVECGISAVRHALILSRNGRPASSEFDPLGFVYFTPENTEGRQRAFNVEMISTFEAMIGDGV